MAATPTISRDTLSQQTRSLVRDRLLRGDFAGARLNESEIALEIGVSRTPLREALRALEQEGLVYSQPGQGFYALPLSVDEVREIYPILWTLEVLALRLRPALTDEELTRLATINTTLESAGADPLRALALDTEWHADLLTPCANKRLLEQITSLKRAAHRYEYAYMQEANRLTISAAQHRQIIDALRKGDVGRAAAALEANWRITLEATDAWLLERSGGAAR
jgi:DNA-binding GntR family transcriptional regulator